MRARTAIVVLAIAAAGWTAAAAPRRSGLDVAGFDRSVSPQDDLYRYVNGGWRSRTAMPPERVTYGTFLELADRTELDLRAIIDDLSARPHARGSTAQQIADLYASVVDERRLESLGSAPIEPELRRIDSIGSTRDLSTEAGYLSSIAAGGPFGGTVDVDPLSPGTPIARVEQGGLLLPDRDYYLSDSAAYADVRAKYRQYLSSIFRLTRRTQPDEDAARVLALETALARISWPAAESRSLDETYTRFTLKQLASGMPGFDWAAWAKPQGIDRVPLLILAEPSFFKAFAAMVPQVPLDTWKAWLISRYVTAAAPYLSPPFERARFDFFGTILTGQELPRTRWKRGVGMVTTYLGDAIGRLYVERHFTPEARSRVQAILANVVDAYRQSIRDADWLSAPARRAALQKLSLMTAGVGAPSSWRSYAGFDIRADDLFGNWQRGLAFESRQHLANAGTGEFWTLPPQTVNAYYRPSVNQIVLPAAVLQPPIFDVDADDAVNYGAAGSLMGHEIGHAFDDRGRRFDARGDVHDWWTPADAARFGDTTARLAAQLDDCEPLPGAHVNGRLAAAETLADLSGLTIAFRAYELSLKGAASPVIDGLTGEQRFFMGWAQMWRAIERDDYVRSTLQTSVHLPPALRANLAASNTPAFYDAFGVTPGQRMYRAPSARIDVMPISGARNR